MGKGIKKIATSMEEGFQGEKFQEVIDTALKSPSVDELPVRSLTILGLSYFQLKRFEEAIPIFQRVYKLEPAEALHPYHLGLCQLESGDLKSAVVAMKDAIQIDPLMQKPYFALANLYIHYGMEDRGIQLLREILVINPFTEVAERVRESMGEFVK